MELQLEAVAKSYKSKQVLKGISLTMETGVYGLLGPNGAGKTTLIRILADVLRPTNGRVLYDRKDIRTAGDEYRAKIGYLPQDVSFYGDFTGRDYLEYSAALKGMEKARAKKRIEELARSVGLWDDLKLKCSAYSGGMKRRLHLATALMATPAVLLLDEPTVGADDASVGLILAMLRRLREKGCAIAMTSHHAGELERVCTRLITLEGGCLVSEVNAPCQD